jgi:hypothetical protein
MLVVAVESTAFATAGYDEVQQLLQLEFCSGELYHYFGVPLSVFEALLAAPSKGRYFHHAILGRYQFVRLISAPLMPHAEQRGGVPWLGR